MRKSVDRAVRSKSDHRNTNAVRRAARAAVARPFENLEDRRMFSVVAHYYNDGFWGNGDGGNGRPLAPSTQFAFPNQQISVQRAGDVATTVPQIAFDFGDGNNGTPGSPAPGVIRNDNHSTVFTGKIVATTAGTYEILGYGDDDTHVFVDGQLVSSNPGGHGVEDPRSAGSTGRGGGATTIELAAGQAYDLVVMQAEGGGGSAVFLRWVVPGGDSAAPVNVPAANLVETITPVAAPVITGRDASYTDGVKIDFTETSKSELRYDLQRRQGAGAWATVGKGFINDTSITDFSAKPGTSYEYRVVGWNLAGETASAPLAVTAPAPAAVGGAQAYAFNDQWWKGGAPINTAGTGVTVGRNPDWSENAGQVGDDENWGDGANGTPGSIEPGVIRFDNHSTVFTGKLRAPEAGTYTILAFTDDDSYFYVNGQLVSADPGGHGIPGTDPAGLASIDVKNPITLAANTDYNFVAVQSEGGGGSGIILRWVTPSMQAEADANGVAAIPTDIPLDAYVSNQPDVPAAPSGLAATAIDVNTLQLTWTDNSTSEVRNVIQRSTSADFSNAVELLAPINATSFIDRGLTAGTQYFYRVSAENFRGTSAAATGTFTTPNASQIPAAPTNLVAYNLGNRNRIVFTDNATNEAGYIVERRLASQPATAFAAVTGSPIAGNGANVTGTLTYEDTNGVVAGQTYVYRVRAVTVDGVQSANSNEATTTVAGLRATIYDPASAFAARNFINDANNANDPIVRVDGEINFEFGDGANGTPGSPAANVSVDTFSIVWEGFVQIDTAGDYTFYGESDDGIRIFIDGQLVVDQFIDRGAVETAGTPVTLTAGKHEIRVQYYENGGGAGARVRYESADAGVAKQIVPVGKLTPADATSPLRAPLSVSGRSIVGDSVVVTWVDNSASETGFRVERSTDGTTFTSVGTVPANQSAFIDDENINADGTVSYTYRVVALGATANSAPSEASAGTIPAGPVAGAVNFADFSSAATQGQFQLNQGGDPTATAPHGEFVNGRLRLTSGGTVPAGEVNPNNGAIATAFLNTPRHVDGFTSSFDFVIGGAGLQTTNPADGFTFIIQAAENQGFAVGATAIGGGGGALGYQGIGNSIAVKFDIYNNLNQTGLYFNGEAISDDPAFARNRVIPAEFDLNAGTPLRATLSYNPTTKVLTQTIDDIGNAATAAYTTTYNVDIPAVIGTTSAYVGFGAGTGGENAQQEILSFAFDPTAPVGIPPIAEVYVRGDTWAGNDNAATVTFKEFMQSSGVGHVEYGYRLSAGPANTDTVSWINANQIVLRYSGPIGAAGVPTPGTVVVDGTRQDYTVTNVTALDDRTVVLTLDRALGNIPGGGVDGDKVRLTVRGAGAAGADYTQVINVLQGDANRDTLGRVNAGDQGYVKSRLNRTTNAPGTGTQTLYTVFADVNADGRVNAADQGAVKSRLNDGMPLTAPAGAFSTTRIADEVLA